MLFADLDAERAQSLADEVGGETRPDLRGARRRLGRDPLGREARGLDAWPSELDGKAPPILSVMAVTPLASINAAFPGVPALRVIPNQPRRSGAA